MILGAGGHALSVADAALAAGWNTIMFYSPDGTGPASRLGPVVSSVDILADEDTAFALGVGTNHWRETVANGISNKFPQGSIVSVVHPNAWVSPHATVHPGAVILAGTAVGPGSTVGRGALLNSGSSLDHESSLGDYASLGPGARTGGNVSVGERTMIGMQAAILHGITVGNDVVVGAHSLVNHHVESNTVIWGVPARVTGIRHKDDPYY